MKVCADATLVEELQEKLQRVEGELEESLGREMAHDALRVRETSDALQANLQLEIQAQENTTPCT